MPQQLHPVTLANWLIAHEPVFLLDVRENWENECCRLPDSKLIPLGELTSRIDEVEPAKNAKIVVYCHHGIRSISGAAILENYGFEDVYSLSGGIDGWSLQIDGKVPRY